MPYILGLVSPVPQANKQAFIDAARRSWPLFKEYGALDLWECWEDVVPDGEVTSFPMAVKREEGEAVVLSFVIWPDKATSEACEASFATDPRWEAAFEMPFDGKRMIWGNFNPVFRGADVVQV